MNDLGKWSNFICCVLLKKNCSFFSFFKIWLVPNRISSNCDHNDQECTEGWCQCAVFGEKGDLYWLLILVPKFPEMQYSSQWTLHAAVAQKEWRGSHGNGALSCLSFSSVQLCCTWLCAPSGDLGWVAAAVSVGLKHRQYEVCVL